MFRLAIVGAAIISVQALLHSGEVQAQDDPSSLNSREDMRGMFLLKWPFGATESSAPRVGFDFEMQRKSDLDYLRENRDPMTGSRIPEIDTGSMRTWSLEEPEFTLPEDLQNEPDKGLLEEPEIVLPDELEGEQKIDARSRPTWSFEKPEFTLPESLQDLPEDEEPGAKHVPSG